MYTCPSFLLCPELQLRAGTQLLTGHGGWFGTWMRCTHLMGMGNGKVTLFLICHSHHVRSAREYRVQICGMSAWARSYVVSREIWSIIYVVSISVSVSPLSLFFSCVSLYTCFQAQIRTHICIQMIYICSFGDQLRLSNIAVKKKKKTWVNVLVPAFWYLQRACVGAYLILEQWRMDMILVLPLIWLGSSQLSCHWSILGMVQNHSG